MPIIENNASLGMTVQKMICDKYGITPNEHAYKQFNSAYDIGLANDVKDVLFEALGKIDSYPVICTTFEKSKNAKETLNPHNFILKNGKTLSIRTNKNRGIVCPRVVGQCGFAVFNDYFSHLVDYEISTQADIRKIVYEKIDLMLPTFIDYLFISDYTLWIYNTKDGYKYRIIDNSQHIQINFQREFFTFTQGIDTWTESTNLKYKGVTLANIQTHKNRSFKCRFYMNAVCDLFETNKITTETLGITAEKTICDKFGLKYPESFLHRFSRQMQKQLEPIVDDAFVYLPDAIEHTGSTKGTRGEQSKCSYDFVLEGNDKLSLKTNTGLMVCPPEVGQPSASTCYLYFKDFIEEDHIDKDVFKKMVLTRIGDIFPIYVEHLFDSDYLLWIYQKKNDFKYRIFKSDYPKKYIWDASKFSFSKPTIDVWNVSCTLFYDFVSIGEFEVHNTRNSYKFRFNLENFSKLIDKE